MKFDPRIDSLQEYHQNLINDLSEAEKQLSYTDNAVTRNRLKRQIEVLLDEIETIQFRIQNKSNTKEIEKRNNFQLTQSLVELIQLPDQLFLFGRDNDISSLQNLVNDNKLVLVQGLAGIGKTSLVVSAIANIRNQFDDIIWLDLPEGCGYSQLYFLISAYFAKHNKVELLENALGQEPQIFGTDHLIALLLEELRKRNILLVIDNFEQILNHKFYIADDKLYSVIRKLLIESYQSHVIFISQIIPQIAYKYSKHYTTYEVTGLDDNSIVYLLDNIEFNDSFTNYKEKLCRLLGGHPFSAIVFNQLLEFFSLENLTNNTELFLDEIGLNLIEKLISMLPTEQVKLLRLLSTVRRGFSFDIVCEFSDNFNTFKDLRNRFLVDFSAPQKMYKVPSVVQQYVYSTLSKSNKKHLHADLAGYYVTQFRPEEIDKSNFVSALEASYHYSRAEDLQNLVQLNVGFTDTLHHLGLVLFKKKEYSNAGHCYQAILNIDNTDIVACFYLAACLDHHSTNSRHKHKKLIDELYRYSLSKKPRSIQYLDYYGYFLMNIGQVSEARIQFQLGVDLSANCPTLYNRYSDLLLQNSDTETAEKILEQGCKLAYNSGPLFWKLCQIKLRNGETNAAKTLLQKGIERNPYYKKLQQLLLDLNNTTDG